MSNFVHVTCSCGCDNRVPLDRRGQWTSCTACGKELSVPDDAPALTTDSAPPVAAIPAHIANRMRNPFEEETTAADFSARFRNYTVEDYEGSASESCSRCGRELRGEWDRLQTPSGLLCYICANQGATGTPERLKQDIDTYDPPRRPRPRVARADTLRHAQSPAQRRLKSLVAKSIVLGIAALFFAAVYVLENFKIDVPLLRGEWNGPRSPDVGQVNRLSLVPWLLYNVWILISTSVGVFIGTFMSLLFTSAVSRQQLRQNVLAAFSLCLPFIVIKLFGIIVLPVFGGDAARATLITLLVAAVQALTLVYIVFEMLDESPWHAMYFLMFVAAFAFATPYLNGFVFRYVENF